ncbi:L-threonylcarbamoyladenylate synthase [Bowmanella sp. JS7-9]|uniref:Threonylcarbamoyl-AMP synthase n=1 Tax=Pseudobowmanella zhangzhouensis TaxID=1537679 RepID=A0ABW1XMC6_9ALTE|nr:L-threonylcarbamoyladenylate synthase [Bowmanella sp. JS7-9]TBX23126.1 hypothetical protein TK45_07905 [Bowmanella sp. JS7-9]
MPLSYTTRTLTLPDDLSDVVDLLQQGECVALPTETVFGLAADASNPDAVAKIFSAKQRPTNHPLIVHISDIHQAERWVTQVPDVAYQLADAFWPGPLSLLMHKHPHINASVTGGLDGIVLRAPNHPDFQAILQASKLGLAAPSANLYKSISPTSANHVLKTLGGRIAAVVETNTPPVCGIESTILDIRCFPPKLLRPGPISAAQISALLGVDVEVPLAHQQVVPGNVTKHYQPQTPAHLCDEQVIHARVTNQVTDRIAWLVYSSEAQTLLGDYPDVRVLSSEPADYARDLYHALHELDGLGCAQIMIETPPQDSAWLAVNDRLRRACA